MRKIVFLLILFTGIGLAMAENSTSNYQNYILTFEKIPNGQKAPVAYYFPKDPNTPERISVDDWNRLVADQSGEITAQRKNYLYVKLSNGTELCFTANIGSEKDFKKIYAGKASPPPALVEKQKAAEENAEASPESLTAKLDAQGLGDKIKYSKEDIVDGVVAVIDYPMEKVEPATINSLVYLERTVSSSQNSGNVVIIKTDYEIYEPDIFSSALSGVDKFRHQWTINLLKISPEKTQMIIKIASERLRSGQTIYSDPYWEPITLSGNSAQTAIHNSKEIASGAVLGAEGILNK